jgi:enoyl-CoA hydratase/carnithine racemase
MTVEVSSIGPVAVIELVRPERRNAIDAATADALNRHGDDAAEPK